VRSTFVVALRLTLVLTALTGVAYPALVTGLARVAFARQAEGGLLVRGGRVVGAALIGQPFHDPAHFWSRPSATSPFAYDATHSSGSNLGPTNPALAESVRARIAALRAADPANAAPVPVDLVTASASGLDPDISEAAAAYQAPRVARASGLGEARVRRLVALHTSGRFLGVFGEPAVHVLPLNLAVDAARVASRR
jgi:K+-transporting ATPase ATPase C chain